MRTSEAVLFDLAAVQCGLFTRAQAIASGCDDALIARRLRAGRWNRVIAGVYGLPGLPRSPDRALWVAHLQLGGTCVVSHEAAAERHGFAAVPRGMVTFIAPRSSHPRIGNGGVVHQLDDLADHHVVVVGGLPTTTIPRTIVDCAAVLRATRLDHLIDQALAERRASLRQIHDLVAEVRRRGKPGITNLSDSLDRHGPGRPMPSNELERLLLRSVLGGGNPAPIAQFAHPGRHPGVGRVDFAYPDVRLILEGDGRTWHQRIADLARDRARDNEAARAGWLTLRFLWEELRDDPEDVGATVREVRATRGRGG